MLVAVVGWIPEAATTATVLLFMVGGVTIGVAPRSSYPDRGWTVATSAALWSITALAGPLMSSGIRGHDRNAFYVGALMIMSAVTVWPAIHRLDILGQLGALESPALDVQGPYRKAGKTLRTWAAAWIVFGLVLILTVLYEAWIGDVGCITTSDGCVSASAGGAGKTVASVVTGLAVVSTAVNVAGSAAADWSDATRDLDPRLLEQAEARRPPLRWPPAILAIAWTVGMIALGFVPPAG